MITHKEYMADSKRLHHAYYLEIARAAGVQIPGSMMERVKGSTDEHYNDIPLDQWDRIAGVMNGKLIASHWAMAMKARGSFASLATGVCAAKALARHITEGGQ